MVASMKMIAFWHIALMIEAVHTSETSVYFNKTTRHNIAESYYLEINFVFENYFILWCY
jgi:hypothetical protein